MVFNKEAYERKYNKKWRKEHPSYMKKYIKDWKERNPDYFKTYYKFGSQRRIIRGLIKILKNPCLN